MCVSLAVLFSFTSLVESICSFCRRSSTFRICNLYSLDIWKSLSGILFSSLQPEFPGSFISYGKLWYGWRLCAKFCCSSLPPGVRRTIGAQVFFCTPTPLWMHQNFTPLHASRVVECCAYVAVSALHSLSMTKFTPFLLTNQRPNLRFVMLLLSASSALPLAVVFPLKAFLQIPRINSVAPFFSYCFVPLWESGLRPWIKNLRGDHTVESSKLRLHVASP